MVGGIAEIVTARPSGNTLAFRDAGGGRFGCVDITSAAAPVALPAIVTGGEVANRVVDYGSFVHPF